LFCQVVRSGRTMMSIKKIKGTGYEEKLPRVLVESVEIRLCHYFYCGSSNTKCSPCADLLLLLQIINCLSRLCGAA
jgi:hypothetical protein